MRALRGPGNGRTAREVIERGLRVIIWEWLIRERPCEPPHIDVDLHTRREAIFHKRQQCSAEPLGEVPMKNRTVTQQPSAQGSGLIAFCSDILSADRC
jgi:hypothetical protein